MPNRLTRQEAAEFIGCGETKFNYLIKSGLLTGTYYSIGNRRYFITEKLKEWMESGGEEGAMLKRTEGSVILPCL